MFRAEIVKKGSKNAAANVQKQTAIFISFDLPS